MQTNIKSQNSGAKITIPCHWDKEIIDLILSKESINNSKVTEVYGVLANGGPVGHGRSSNSVVEITREKAIFFREYLRERGLNFTYLLNAPFNFDGSDEQKHKLDDYLDWILNKLHPSALTIASHELMQYVRQMNRDIPIHISTIAGVKSVADLKKYLDISPNRVVPHHDVGKDWKSLRELVNFGKIHDIEVEVMATESCLLHCPRRQGHYEYLAKGVKDYPFHTTCNAEKLMYPREFLLAGGVIRPEDMKLYEDMGVKYFKLTGRSKPAEWLIEVAEAYIKREYNGNLVRLLGIDPSIKAEDWIYISNKALDGFIVGFPQNENYNAQTVYCDRWISKMYDDGNFKLLDGSTFLRKGNTLAISKCGERAQSIISREFGK